jgi:hypothetical protein
MAASAASTPASAAASTAATPAPAVSWVWKWTGMPTSCRSADISARAACGPAEAGHVRDAEDVGAGGLALAGHPEVVGQVVLVAGGVDEVAGVADGHAHVVDPAQRSRATPIEADRYDVQVEEDPDAEAARVLAIPAMR